MNFFNNDVATFIEVVRCGSVSRAAEKVGQTQPAISKAIRRLEQEVGVPLLERGAKGARLTGEGQMFLETARRFEAQHFELVRMATDLRARHAGLLRLGITSPAADSIAVRAIAELVRRRPAMRLQLEIGKSDVLNDQVENGELDLAVVPTYSGQALSCTRIDIGEDRMHVVVRADHPLLRLPAPAIHDLTPYGWVMPSAQSAARRHVLEIFARHAAPRPHVCVEVEYTSEAVMGVLMATDLLALVPASVLRSWLGRVQPLPLREFAIQRSQVLLSHPQAQWTPLMAAFRQLVLDQRPAPLPSSDR